MPNAKDILEYIAESTMLPSNCGISVDTPLFSSQVLDSLNMVALIAFLEETFGIEVKPMDIAVENFDTVNRMLAYVERRKRENE